MKSAMQELIEWGDDMLLKHPNKILSFSDVIDKAEELLEKEKEQIIDAYCSGYRQGEYQDEILCEEYYNETYQNK